MVSKQLQTQKSDIGQTRWVEAENVSLQDGQVRLKVDQVAFTANNITYAVMGQQFGYWQFFPTADEEWGIIPTWGFADIVESNHPDFEIGERVYGYLPMATELVITPGDVKPMQFKDVSEHRVNLPMVYNVFVRTKNDPFYDADLEPYRSLWFPLAGTSYGLADWLEQTNYQNAEAVCLVSASSKTSLGLAHMLKAKEEGKRLIGITSAGNKASVEDLGYYDEVLTYQDIEAMAASVPTVIVDFSGNGETLSQMHRHLGDNMTHTVIVGASHWEEERKGEGYISERSELFFMPAYAAQRAKETEGAFFPNLYGACKDVAEAAAKWMSLVEANSPQEIEALYTQVKDGALSADQGGIINFSKLG